MRDWVSNIECTCYMLGSVVGPHAYRMLVRDFQSVIGRETIRQVEQVEGRLPHCCMACVGGGSNAMGMFYPFLEHREVRLIGVEAAGHGLDTDMHSATLVAGTPGVLHGSMSYVLQDENGLITIPHSVSAGLDYPGVGPEHSHLKASGRVQYTSTTDREALKAFRLLTEQEGIIPALEPSHAIARAAEIAAELGAEGILVLCLSGRGDKDVGIIAEETGVRL
jgi:tryptophan synthase beta chain